MLSVAARYKVSRKGRKLFEAMAKWLALHCSGESICGALVASNVSMCCNSRSRIKKKEKMKTFNKGGKLVRYMESRSKVYANSSNVNIVL